VCLFGVYRANFMWLEGIIREYCVFSVGVHRFCFVLMELYIEKNIFGWCVYIE
jgi:hypothetical protein